MKKPNYVTPSTEFVSLDLYKDGVVICASIESFGADEEFFMINEY